jgi:hypothetical protein
LGDFSPVVNDLAISSINFCVLRKIFENSLEKFPLLPIQKMPELLQSRNLLCQCKPLLTTGTQKRIW